MNTTIIVSAFFKIPSKKSYEFYHAHLVRWFRSIRSHVIFFTSEEVYTDIINMGFELSHIQFQLMSVNDFVAWGLGRDFWDRQKERDVERYHTPEVAAIWYEKKEFVKRAFALSTADVFIWCDAGAIRNEVSEHVAHAFGSRNAAVNDGRIHLQCIGTHPYCDYYMHPACKYAGAIIAGNREAWVQFTMIYQRVMQEYDHAGVSCNSDQYVMMSCNDRMPTLFCEHKWTQSTVDPWFFLLEIL